MKLRSRFIPMVAGTAVIALLAAVFPPQVSAEDEDDKDGFFKAYDARWLTYKADAGRTASENPLLRVPLELAWESEVGRSVGATPAAAGEYIFVSTRDRKIAILERTSGERRQRRSFKGGFGGSVLIDGSKMYFNTRYPGKKVYGTDINTEDNHFEREVGSTIVSPIVDFDRLFAFPQSGKVVSLNTEAGYRNWETDIEGNIEHHPLYIDPFIYVPTIQGKIYKIDSSTGEAVGEMDTGGLLLGDLCSDGYFLFIATSSGKVLCLEPDSLKTEWETDHELALFSAPVYSKGYLYLCGREGSLVKLAALDGSLVWEKPLAGVTVAPPAVSDDYLFTGTKSGHLAAHDIESGEQLWEKRIEEGVSCSPLVYMDYVYFCTDRGKVYAFHTK